MSYTSFLICDHGTHADVYVEGLPIGVIRGSQFNIHHNTMPDGSRRPVRIDDTAVDRVSELVQIVIDSRPAKSQT